MQQLFAAFGINWKLLIIQGINFSVLLAILSYFLYRPLMKVIDERREKIAEGVRAAEAASGRLADAKTESDNIVGAGTRHAEELVALARTRAGEKEAELVGAAQMKADAVMRDAQARAEESKRTAMQESHKEIARAAMLAAEKILATK